MGLDESSLLWWWCEVQPQSNVSSCSPPQKFLQHRRDIWTAQAKLPAKTAQTTRKICLSKLLSLSCLQSIFSSLCIGWGRLHSSLRQVSDRDDGDGRHWDFAILPTTLSWLQLGSAQPKGRGSQTMGFVPPGCTGNPDGAWPYKSQGVTSVTASSVTSH